VTRVLEGKTMGRVLSNNAKIAIILGAVVLLFNGAAAASTPTPLSHPDRESLLKAAVDLKEAILRQDIDGFLHHVSKLNGLTCTDTQIQYQQIKKDLHNKESHLYMSLFDSTRFSKQCGHQYPREYPAISDKEFFSKATNMSIEITRAADGWAQVTYKSETKGHYPREYTFHKEGSDWKLTEGVVVDSCSCG
jgi:hypothetical protein